MLRSSWKHACVISPRWRRRVVLESTDLTPLMKLFSLTTLLALNLVGAVTGSAAEAPLLSSIQRAAVGDARIEQSLKPLYSRGDSSRLWSQLGAALAQKQRETESDVWYDHAEAAYEEARRLDPGNLEALTGLAWVWGGRHDFVKSVRWARAALELDPANPEAHGILGDAALELGDRERALESYQQMIESRPDLSSYSRAGWLLWVMGRREEAAALMQLAIECGGPHAENTAWCRARLAQMLRESGRAREALQVTELGLLRCHAHRLLLLEQAHTLVVLQRSDAALRIYEGVLEKKQTSDVLLALAALWEGRRQPEKAASLRQRAAGLADHPH